MHKRVSLIALLFGLFAMACATGTPSTTTNTQATQNNGTAANGATVHAGNHSAEGRRILEQALAKARQGQLKATIALARTATEKAANLEDAYLLWGSACTLDTQDCAEEAYQKGLTALPNSAALLNERGLLRLRREQLDEGKADLLRAVEIDHGRDPRYLADLAYAHVMRKELEDAVQLAEKAQQADPKCFECALVLGQALLAQNKAEPALTALRTAENLEPSDANVKMKVAAALRLLRRPEEAAAIYQALAKEVDDFRLAILWADALLEAKQPQQAVHVLEEALEKTPQQAELQERLQRAQKAATAAQPAKQRPSKRRN